MTADSRSRRKRPNGLLVAVERERLRHERLVRECAKLDPEEEKALAEEGLDASAGAAPPY